MKLQKVIEEAERFIAAAKVEVKFHTIPATGAWPACKVYSAGMENANIKRLSMDLSRKLAALRRTRVAQWRD